MSLDAAIAASIGSSQYVKAQEDMASLAGNDRWRRFIFREPQFSYTNSDSINEESWGLSLATPFPGRAFAATELDRVNSEKEHAEIDAKRQDQAKLIADSYLECASSRALLEIQKVALRDLETVAHSLSAMYESGHASQAERIGAELQVRQTHADLVVLENKSVTSCHKWRALMGKQDDPNVVPDGVPDDLKPETVKALGSAPAAEARSRAALAVANANDSLRWWNQAPDIQWSYARNHYLYLPGSPTGKEWTTTVGVAVTVPIFWFFAESIEAQRARAQAQIDRHNAEVDSVNARDTRVAAAQEFMRDKDRIRELREKDLALAEALVQSTLAAYRVGKLGFAELMMSRKTLSDLRAQEVQLQTAVIQARLQCLSQCEHDRGTL